MVLRIITFFFTVVPMIGYILADEKHSLMMYMVKYMKENLSTYQVTVLTKSTRLLGRFSSSIVKIMIDEFSSVVVDSSAMDTIPANRSYGNLWDRTSDQSKLKIGIVELGQSSDTNEELSDMLDFFMQYSKSVRGKCIIFLINGQGLDLESFLKFAWTKDFLDLTVVEWISVTSKKSLTSSKSASYEIFIHVFNPFEKKYVKEVFTNNTDVLPDKMKNLHGYNLDTFLVEPGLLGHVDENYSGPNKIDKFDDEEVHLTKLLEETLNFTAIPKSMKFEEWMNCCKRNNVSCIPPTDFSTKITSLTLIGPDTDTKEYMELLESPFTDVYMPALEITRLYLIQKKVTEAHTSRGFLISCCAFITILMTFSLFSRILKLDKKIWSVIEIAQALLGGSIAHQKNMRLKEKIFLVTVYFTSIIMMALTSDELLKLNLDEQKVLRFKSLKELADSGESIRITNWTREQLLNLGKYSPVLQKIADQSIASEAEEPNLGNMPHDQSDTSVYGGLDQTSLGLPSVGSFDQNWFVSAIEEDIIWSMNIMQVRENFPYKDRFEKIILKLRGTGLLIAYSRKEIDNLKRVPWKESSMSGVFHLHHDNKNDIDIEIPLEKKLIMIIVIGYGIACVRLAYEIVIKRFGMRRVSVKVFSTNNVKTHQKPKLILIAFRILLKHVRKIKVKVILNRPIRDGKQSHQMCNK
ncbi:hypothetical protein QAD02_010910 [Eretmocerus hayati]|uniref:Uncharacterized protein n=1 Tax=Eretmocerus hayati TaxID=131215 RepID=A0ACC2NXV3_9HYME|nr:hypothetical protein QAD02_010910 [Eretmocerus hayati]